MTRNPKLYIRTANRFLTHWSTRPGKLSAGGRNIVHRTKQASAPVFDRRRLFLTVQSQPSERTINGMFMSSCIRIRASANPADFFDEIIPEEGLEFNGWRFTRHQFPDIMTTEDGAEVGVVSRWLYAETDCEPGRWADTLREKQPSLHQALQVLKAIRQSRIAEELSFSMWFEDYQHNGCTGNIAPYKLNVSVGIQNFQTRDPDGNVVFDARVAQEEYERQMALEARQKALEERKAAKLEVHRVAK